MKKKINYQQFSDVKINDNFWNDKIETVQNVTINQCLDKCVETGRIENFKVAGNLTDGMHKGIVYDDSDVFKILEGAAYSLSQRSNIALEKRVDEIIDFIAAAQEDSGYLNTYYTIRGEKPWTDMDKHEMYNGGHMIEAAIAYKNATGKEKFLEVVINFANHLLDQFGPGKRNWVAGHQEIELALVKLYEVTGNKEYLDFSHWLLEQRGNGYGHNSVGDNEWNESYYQDIIPVKQITRVSGHAVRAMYMFTAMADVSNYIDQPEYIDALKRVWNNVVNQNMYVTGGIGSSKHNEGFTEDYDLLNEEAYCETCASVGMVLWNQRMFSYFGDSKYLDVLERAMYNGVISGLSLSGKEFFYVNPLYSNGEHHRKLWYNTSCCPTQISRFIPSIGNYIYSSSEDSFYVNLFISSETESRGLKVTQETLYPYNGKVKINISSSNHLYKYIRIRIPEWTNSFKVLSNGEACNFKIESGFIVLELKNVNSITVDFNMDIQKIKSIDKVKENIGKTAIQYGPIVYCIEEVDCVQDFEEIKIASNDYFVVNYDPNLLGGINVINVYNNQGELKFKMVPYFAWDNREAGKMKVWIDEEIHRELYYKGEK